VHRVGLVLTIAVATAFAQNSKSVSKLSDSFANSGIEALFALQRWSDRHDKPSEKKAEEAVDKARAEHNPDNPAEAHMMSNLAYLWIKHETVLMQVEANIAQSHMSGGDAVDVDGPLSAENHCVGIMETAFRKRTDIKMPKNAMVG
jgi:hypothetical protein